MTVAEVVPAQDEREQSRARYPDDEGFIERDGVRVFWESYGKGEQTILFLPTSCTRVSGRRRSRTSRATSVSSASTRGATAAPTGRMSMPPTPSASSPRTRSM